MFLKNQLSLLLAATLLTATWVAPSVANASDPDIHWEQIETPHFLIIFDSKHYDLGVQYAHFAEQAFLAVTPTFGLWPEKTTVIVNDSSDLANGFATGTPYALINAFPVLPSPLDAISDYGNWGVELLTHEYTHILTFEPATGVARPLRWVFGSIIRPNAYLPRWYLEGLAVYMETRASSFGRLRSANFLSIPRALVNEDLLRTEDIARINETSIPDFPGGNRPYLMGSLLWDQMVSESKDGAGLIGELNLDYSRRFPFFINGPVENRLGADYQTLLDRTYDRVEKMVDAQIASIDAAGRTSHEDWSRQKQEARAPAVSPDGKWLAYVARHANGGEFVEVQPRPSVPDDFTKFKVKMVKSADGVNRIAWLPEGHAFIYDAIDTSHHYSEFSDLYRADLDFEKEKIIKTQLTHGVRAHEPATSPDGKTILFAQNLSGATALGLVNVDGSRFTTLYAPPPQTRISFPEFLSNDQVIFSERSGTGIEVLKVARLKNQNGAWSLSSEPREVLREFAPARLPRLTNEGLLFTSDRSGVSNFYLAPIDAAGDLKTARAISNVATRVADGTLDPVSGDLVFTLLHARGWGLAHTTNANWKNTKTPPQVAALVDHSWPQVTTPTPEVEIKREDYNPFPYLIPRYWLPYAYSGPDGVILQASTDASDPTGRHSYALAGTYDLLSQKPSVFGQYTNRITPVAVSLLGENVNEYLVTTNTVRHTTSGGVGGTFFLLPNSEKWQGGLALQTLQTDTSRSSLNRGGARVTLAWSDVKQQGLEISPERGGSFVVNHAHYFPTWGNIEYEQTDISSSYYFSKWLPDRHALAVFANASIAPRLDRFSTFYLGQSTVGANYQTSLFQPHFVMRGYQSGVFLGRNMVSGTMEYRFPISYQYHGFGTHPFFIQRVHADVFADAVTLDGSWFDNTLGYQTAKLGSFFVGYGAEMKLDATIFYQLPAQIILGAYAGANSSANPNGVFPFIGLGL